MWYLQLYLQLYSKYHFWKWKVWCYVWTVHSALCSPVKDSVFVYLYLYLQLYSQLYFKYLFWKWKVWCYVVQTGVVHTSAHQLRPQPVSVASVEGRMASGLCATNLGPPGVWRQTLITVPPNLGIQSQLTPFLLWPGGSNWRNVRAGTTNKRRESKQEGGVEHQSHISLSETADHPSSSCEQK